MRGHHAVDGFAFRHHRTALGGRDEVGGIGEVGNVLWRQSVIAKLAGGDEGAVHDEVGIAADRRSEVRVVGKREAEVPGILGR